MFAVLVAAQIRCFAGRSPDHKRGCPIQYLELTDVLKSGSVDCVIIVEWRRQCRRIARELANVATYGHGTWADT
jgi:hypothetical protein